MPTSKYFYLGRLLVIYSACLSVVTHRRIAAKASEASLCMCVAFLTRLLLSVASDRAKDYTDNDKNALTTRQDAAAAAARLIFPNRRGCILLLKFLILSVTDVVGHSSNSKNKLQWWLKAKQRQRIRQMVFPPQLILSWQNGLLLCPTTTLGYCFVLSTQQLTIVSFRFPVHKKIIQTATISGYKISWLLFPHPHLFTVLPFLKEK